MGRFNVARYPVIAGTSLLAIAATVALWKHVDVSPLLQSALIRRGELARLITSIFPHFNFLILIFDLLWLWLLGTVLEEKLGHLKTLGIILLLAFGSGALQFGFSVNGAGLSGVVFGLFGLLAVLSLLDKRFRGAMSLNTALIFGAWFLICAVFAWMRLPQFGYMNNVAHGAGLVIGILLGFVISVKSIRIPVAFALGALILFFLCTATLLRPLVHRNGEAGDEEARWGHDALAAHRDVEAAGWLRDAANYQPLNGQYWHELATAEQRLRNWRAARQAYFHAAFLHNPESEFVVGFMYANGYAGLQKSDSLALFWFRKAANDGNADAENQLGIMYDYGRGGLTRDENQALYWYRKSADQGNPGGENDLAWLCATSTNPAIRNPEIALEYAQRAVKANPDPSFLDTLAEAYYINGQYADAVKTEQQVLEMVSRISPPPPHVDEFRQRLAKYRQALQQENTLRQGRPVRKSTTPRAAL